MVDKRGTYPNVFLPAKIANIKPTIEKNKSRYEVTFTALLDSEELKTLLKKQMLQEVVLRIIARNIFRAGDKKSLQEEAHYESVVRRKRYR